MIEARGLTKRYGSTVAVDGLSFTIRPGVVTGFLGPNGAGKTTTMRLILGLDYPSGGTVTVNGRPYQQLASPMHEVGALLEAGAVHGGRSAYNHLLCLAQANDISRRRVAEVLGIVGLGDVAKERSKGFSLGMSQRLGIAAALLGDPQILLFDEPVNGLDPEGILWIRTRRWSEMEHTADHLLVVGRGKLIADCGMAEFIARSSGQVVLVRTPQPGALATAVTAAGASVRDTGAAGISAAASGPAELEVSRLTEVRVGDIAFANGIRLHHLATSRVSLEQAFMELTSDSVEYHAGVPADQPLAHSGSARDGRES